MAKKRISFLVYFDHWGAFEELSFEERGRLITYVYKYAQCGDIPEIGDRALRMAFNIIKQKLDDDMEKYSETCEKRRAAVNKRYEDEPTSEYNCIQKYTNATDKTRLDESRIDEASLEETKDNISSANAELVQNSGENAAVSAHSARSFSSTKNKSMPSANKNSVPYAEIKDLFNAKCDMLPRIRDITETRRRKLFSRWREHPSLSFFEDYFAKVAESDFLCGRVGRFHAGFDWLLEPANMQKVLEGNYENKADVNPFNKPLELDMEGFGDV